MDPPAGKLPPPRLLPAEPVEFHEGAFDLFGSNLENMIPQLMQLSLGACSNPQLGHFNAIPPYRFVIETLSNSSVRSLTRSPNGATILEEGNPIIRWLSGHLPEPRHFDPPNT